MTNKAELKDRDAAEAKRESIATDTSFEWKSTQAHQQDATTLHNLGILISNTNQLLEQINRHGRFYVDIQGLCRQEEMQGNDKKSPAMIWIRIRSIITYTLTLSTTQNLAVCLSPGKTLRNYRFPSVWNGWKHRLEEHLFSGFPCWNNAVESSMVMG